jgi:hypothetical protein
VTSPARVPRTSDYSQRYLALATGAVLAQKAYAAIVYGPDLLGDHIRLGQYADLMLAGWSWLFGARIHELAIPPELWKPPGYPILMALAKLIAGAHWAWFLIALQSTASFLAGFYVRRLALALGLSSGTAVVAFLLYEFSVPASTDVLILADGLYGSISTMILCRLSTLLITRDQLPLRSVLIAATGMLVCLLIREIFVYFVILFAVALAFPLWKKHGKLSRVALVLGVFCLPTLLGGLTMAAWNKYRTGSFLTTSGGQTAYLYTVLKVAEKAPQVLDGNSPIDVIGRQAHGNYDYGPTLTINERLFDQYGITAPQQVALAERKFWKTAFQFPVAFAKVMADRFRFRQQASMCGDVMMRLDDLDWWRDDAGLSNYYSGWRARAQQFLNTRDFSQLDFSVVVNVVPRLILRVIMIGLFLLFMIGIPLLVVLKPGEMRWPDPIQSALLLGLYVLYWLFIGLHLPIALEIRYLSPVCSIPILGALVVWQYGKTRFLGGLPRRISGALRRLK